MHYNINNITIFSENAAKSYHQPCSEIIKWLNSIKNVNSALDYGCGKLRYFPTLHKKAKIITLVDSEIQLNRVQKVLGLNTSITDYIKNNYSNTKTLTPAEFEKDEIKYNLALCINVLSSIPFIKARTKVVRNIYNSMEKNGLCLFATQFKNSYFKEKKNDIKTIKHLDGWIVVRKNSSSFYGIIEPQNLKKLITQGGFEIKESWVKGQSSYVIGYKSINEKTSFTINEELLYI